MELLTCKSNVKPAALLNLNNATYNLAILLFRANAWMPEEDWRPLAEKIHPHLCAMYLIFKKMANKNTATLDDDYDGIGFLVREELLCMQNILMDRQWSERINFQRTDQVIEKLKRLFGLVGQEPDADEELEGGAA